MNNKIDELIFNNWLMGAIVVIALCGFVILQAQHRAERSIEIEIVK